MSSGPDIGGFADFHGSGRGRHLHAELPSSDTLASRLGRSAGEAAVATGGGVVFQEGSVSILVNNPAANVDVERAVYAGIEKWRRDRSSEPDRAWQSPSRKTPGTSRTLRTTPTTRTTAPPLVLARASYFHLVEYLGT